MITVPLAAAACSESEGRRDWFQTAAAHNVVWHTWARDRDELFCAVSRDQLNSSLFENCSRKAKRDTM